ncbi:MAG: peptidase domain-containing ABC transporter [Scytonematopsis contorta HA4267-MV1]|jgi:ATP-binding cassette subfamily B protein|nr:peptidase domain-containing ABC transporter [Scytonematopsis contorta HA4267-MV1]
MTSTQNTIQDFLAELFPFNQLEASKLEDASKKIQFFRYRMGQPIIQREQIPTKIYIIYEGQARLLGYDHETQMPITLQTFKKGEILGWTSLIRGIACETVLASDETICLTLEAKDFLSLVKDSQNFANAFQNLCSTIEVFDLLSNELSNRADGKAILDFHNANDIKELTFKIIDKSVIYTSSRNKIYTEELDPNLTWFVSSGELKYFSPGSRLNIDTNTYLEKNTSSSVVRLIGLPLQTQIKSTNIEDFLPSSFILPSLDEIPYATNNITPIETNSNRYSQTVNSQKVKYPYAHGRSPVEATLACFQMLSQYWNIPFRQEVIRKVLTHQVQRTQTLSLQLCGAVAELIGLDAQLINVTASSLTKLQVPAIIRWQDSFAILYEINGKKLVLGVPSVGILQQKPAHFIENWGDQGQVLLLKANKYTPKKRFGLSWFIPSLIQYRKVLFEVLIASFFVQIFTLANPLIVQIIIDKVIVQNSLNTLNIFGILLVVIAIFEAILTSIRTNLFTDTTNRIDLALGSEIIEHLLRLPLPYFEKRTVGELATRTNELENIRSFLTGTALTVVLDAVFSVVYIAVMFVYSWLMTLVALATIPLFMLLTILVSPIIQRQLRSKAEKNAQTQSYLVEVLSGIQTVKAQNIELHSRWQWQEHYTSYVDAGFKTTVTSTAAASTSNFLNQISGLLVLWLGAYLVVKGELTLGQLIAFRIIANYVTAPLLRLSQLWQNFQETALSLERLSDILNSPTETEEADRKNISMPVICGAVSYENLCFRFNSSSQLQLKNINLDLAPGKFIGIVGQSGSGKSTLTKLLTRLYEPESGKITIDGYDISKVELHSLRRQIGMVLQDSLLFDGTIQENIALANPDATTEEIIEAAKIAAAHEFIMSLPQGYNTKVGERGSALSGGQRQRIAIARTVLQNPNLLILDEATSALDYQSEREVCLNLAQVFSNKTVFFITHRLSTIKNADVILLLHQGTVAEQGTHQELMSLRGHYYCLYQQQEAQL